MIINNQLSGSEIFKHLGTPVPQNILNYNYLINQRQLNVMVMKKGEKLSTHTPLQHIIHSKDNE